MPVKCIVELSKRPWFMAEDKTLQRLAKEAFLLAGGSMSRGLSFRCWQCGSWNHTFKWCIFDGLRTCHECHLFGHFAQDCPNVELMQRRVLPVWRPLQADFTPRAPAGNH